MSVLTDNVGELTSQMHRLRAAGVEVIVYASDGLPEVLHWGHTLEVADLHELRQATAPGVPPSAFDDRWTQTLAPTEHDGWQGRPAFAVHRTRRAVVTRWSSVNVQSTERELTVEAVGDDVLLTLRLALDDAGVLWFSTEITNVGSTPLDIDSVESVMPVGESVAELLDFTGRWTRERSPQRVPLTQGSHSRESRRGRTGHDSPLLTILGEQDFTESTGQLWGVHLAWSADSVYRNDILPEARPALGAGPLLRSGEISLAPGESYLAPAAAFVWSDSGLDGLSDRFHRSLRARPSHVSTPRPVTLNTWEAVYFDHDLERLTRLADTGAGVGVERFVLDDGWFTGRRSDKTSLGDWAVDPTIWPVGLHPLVDHVRSLGMQFGLWFEPEMVSPDSDLAREHPEWLLAPQSGPGRTWRHQHVLNLAIPEVSEYLLTRIGALVGEYKLDYIKWDHNRDLLESVHDGTAAVTRHTEAVYALLDELRRQFPTLEIESCSSGGARVDLGILARTDRVWPSDTNDPIERLEIQRWTELLLPPESIGAHVGPASAHTTRRHSDLSLRIATALIGSMGIEWDITLCSPDELDELKDAITAYRRLRPLIHTGRLAHPSSTDDGLRVTTVTSPDQTSGLVRIVRVATDRRARPPLLRIPGLAPHATYRVRPVPELRAPRWLDVTPPPWITAPNGLRASGSALAHLGVRIPMLGPGQAFVLEITDEKSL